MSNLLDVFGDYSAREIKRIMPIVKKIESYEKEMSKLTDEELRNKTEVFKFKLSKGKTLDDILPEAFAVVREAAYRVLNMKHYEVQLIGGIVLHQGRIAEMKTGEGKTLVATLPAYLNALTGKGVHIVTTNDYLAKRDRDEMGQIHEFLGLTVGVILHDMEPEERRTAYNMDITYGTNNELGFDYLRDNMAISREERVMRSLNYVIVDEIDSILIDEARTPLLIAGEGDEPSEVYYAADNFVKKLKKDEHYVVDNKVKAVTLTEAGVELCEKEFGIENLADEKNRNIQHHVVQALKANYIMMNNRDYIVNDGEVLIVDEFTGRVMDGRRFNEGLHEAIEAKEGLEVNNESKTLATITLQNFFKLYNKLSGMTGTAYTEQMEFREIYNLDVVVIPTNKPVKRIDHNDEVYKTTRAKYNAIVREVIESHEKGQPVLVGTSSIEKSEDISALLKRKGIKHYVLNAKNHALEAKIIAKAGEKGAVTIATNMAGRGTDIKLAPGVAELGGLKVIGTDRHESRRIDNQLRGRSGRQGDPGSSKFIISLEDELLKHFMPERFKELVEKMAMDENVPLEGKLLNKAIESAQKAVEANNFAARKNLVSYDDIVNVQRKVIYDERNRVLDGEDLRDDILSMLSEVINRMVTEFLGDASSKERDEELKNLIVFAEELCIPSNRLSYEELKGKTNDELEEIIYSIACEVYEEAEKTLGEDRVRTIEKVALLKTVDEKWIEHIDNMEYLKEGIGLRAFKQVDPVQIFQIESSEIFYEMLYSIKYNTIKQLFYNLKTNKSFNN
ncbi:preprotein translocase subunit SecA [Clostridium thermarum]|uniref:preprotein translocase subunit SecA n=1 Tax=Clostridium thermarum TaxID=1716543 RepID=UPI00111E1DD1|nr:preprotein translocase subunit SecA [Clostridium thermarum]